MSITCDFQNSTTNVFATTLALNNLSESQQQYYDGFIYGATNTYLFKYDINLPNVLYLSVI